MLTLTLSNMPQPQQQESQWRKPHKFQQSPVEGRQGECVCGCLTESPLHTTPTPRESREENRSTSGRPAPGSKWLDGCEIKDCMGDGHTFMPDCEKYNPTALPNAAPQESHEAVEEILRGFQTVTERARREFPETFRVYDGWLRRTLTPLVAQKERGCLCSPDSKLRYHVAGCPANNTPTVDTPTPRESREEGVFYPESVMPYSCCENCGDVHFEKTYPAHTAYYACRNLKCKCHAPHESHEAVEEIMREFDQKWPLPKFLALSGGAGVQRDQQLNWLHSKLTPLVAQKETQKVPCTCPKGGIDGYGRVCPKCNGSEWVDAPRDTHTQEGWDWESRFDDKFDFFECAALNGMEIKSFIKDELRAETEAWHQVNDDARREAFEAGRLQGIEEAIAILTDELKIAHTTTSGKTSRLTSALNRLYALQEADKGDGVKNEEV